jgi:hypothetical protein
MRAQKVQQMPVIGGARKNRLPVVTALDDVVRVAW